MHDASPGASIGRETSGLLASRPATVEGIQRQAGTFTSHISKRRKGK
jgi:hypothetical protein